MKSILLTLITAFAFTSLLAQPNFTSADMPNVGDQDTLMILQYHPLTNNLDIETGSGYNWDFTALPFNVQNFIDIDSFRVKQHPESANFPNATIEEFKTGVSAQTLNLYSYNNDTLFIHRLGSPSTPWALSPMASILFPIAFNNSSVLTSNVYTGTNFSILAGQRTTTAHYDGFGTLNMPNGRTYGNVFRVKLIERDTNFVTHTITLATSYIWYKQGGQVPLLRLVYTGATNLYFVFGSKSNNTSSGTTGTGQANSTATLSLTPNPTTGRFQITLDGFSLTQHCTAQVYNLQGVLIQQASITKPISTLDLSHSPKGLYFVKITDGQKTLTQKVSLE